MITKNNLIFGSLLAIGMTTTVCVGSSQAATSTSQAFPVFEQPVPPGTMMITTNGDGCVRISVPPYTCIPGTERDQRTIRAKSNNITLQANGTVPVIEIAYFQTSSSPSDPFNFKTGNVLITTILGRDLNPTMMSPPIVPPNSVTGFDPNDPEIVPLDTEIFFGQSTGTIYPADLSATVTLANLATFLPGYDLSPFTGDPNSIVYVSQVTIPAFDVIISTPEPSAFLGLLTLGLLGSGLTYKRKRQKRLIDSDDREVTRI